MGIHSPDVAPAAAAAKPLKPCRSGRTGQRPFGSLGPKIDVKKYDEQLSDGVVRMKKSLSSVVGGWPLSSVEVFPSPPTGHRHRAGPLIVVPGSVVQGSNLELAMWDSVVKKHSIVRAHEVPIYSPPIAASMEALRTMPIALDPELSDILCDSHCSEPQQDAKCCLPGKEPWGSIIGRGLRSIQFHSTLSGQLLVCCVYHDPRLKTMKRTEQLPEEETEVWIEAARMLRRLLESAVVKRGVAASVDVIGRWKRRRLVVERDFVDEHFKVADGRTLKYRQPEGQFSNPNAPCEIKCLDWLCREAQRIRRDIGRGPTKLLELHCGGANNTVALAPYFNETVAVEINRVLAEAAEENLKANGITNVRLVRSASANAAGDLGLEFEGGHLPQVVLVDPPRSGLDAQTRELVSKFDNVLYISCNPVALAQDLRHLTSHDVISLAFFDMFPYTTHCECAVRLRRSSAKVCLTARWSSYLFQATSQLPILRNLPQSVLDKCLTGLGMCTVAAIGVIATRVWWSRQDLHASIRTC